jgi:hypothetical protein
MKNRQELLSEAASLKLALVKRAQKLLLLNELTAKYDAGFAPDIKVQRYDTMREEYENLKQRQLEERHRYATIRWMLGITPDVDINNLELER